MPYVDLHKIADHYKMVGEVSRLESIGDWLDSSKINEFNLCPRRYFYRHEMGLVKFQPMETINWASPMTFGHAIHAALASLYDGTAFVKSTCPCVDICSYCKGDKIPRILAQFLINYPDDPSDPRDPRTRDRGIEIIITYLERFSRESHFEVIGVELPFAVPMISDGAPFTYIGRIDLLVKEDGKLKPWDHKTTTRFGMIFEQQFSNSGQLTGYMRSTHLITGEPIYQADINAIRVTTRINEESFMRLTTSRTDDDFLAWEKDVQRSYLEILRCRQDNYWPKRAPFACSAYNRTCDYFGLCTAGSDRRRNELITSAYEVRPWSPIMED